MSFIDRIHAVMARVAVEVPGTSTAIGADAETEHGAPPHATWVPREHARTVAAQGEESFARAILARAQTYTVRLWGADAGVVESLFDALVRACEAEASGAWQYQGGSWETPSATDLGEQMLVTLVLVGHVAERPSTTDVIISATVRRSTGAASGDGVLEPGEP